MRKSNVLVCGIGTNEGKYPVTVEGKPVKEYNLWKSVLQRCNEKFWTKRKTYSNCCVSDNFKSYAFFYEWCQTQTGFGVDGWQLDKDILIKDNKLYSEDTCVFVPPEINCLFRQDLRGTSAIPTGASFRKRENQFAARCHVGGGNLKRIGDFKTAQEAREAYQVFKKAHVLFLAEKWKDFIDARVYAALTLYDVR